jgi:hypothetical protein
MEGSLVAYKVFTNGSTLQASELNENLMQQSVAVFSNSAARTAAIISPVEGQMTWLEDVNRHETYNGTIWIPASGMNFISQVAGTAVNAINVNNCFSGQYKNYKIIYNGTVSSGSIGVRLRAAGSDEANPLYRAQQLDASGTSVSAARSVGDTSWGGVFVPVGVNTRNVLEIASPFETVSTSAHSVRLESPAGNIEMRLFNWGINSTLSYTGISLISGGATMTGTVTVYGYNLG